MLRLVVLASFVMTTSVTRAQTVSSDHIVYVGSAYLGPTLRRATGVVFRLREGRIVEIKEQQSPPPGADTFPTATATPGLIDAHVYLTATPNEPDDANVTYTAERYTLIAATAAVATLCGGVTTVRDMGAPGMSVFAVREAVARGEFWGPRILAVGPGISAIGGHTDLGGLREDVRAALAHNVSAACSGADDCAALVRKQSRDGVDAIRISGTGGILSDVAGGFGAQFSDAEIESITAAASGLSLSVAVSGQGGVGLNAYINRRAATLEMVAFLAEDQARAMRDKGVALASGLTLFGALEQGLEKGRFSPAVAIKARAALAVVGQAVRFARDAGTPIVMASFAGVVAHGTNANEIAQLVDLGGLTPLAALRAATIDAAAALGIGDKTGDLSVGKAGDLVILPLDPIANKGRIGSPLAVYAAGRLVPAAFCRG